MIIVEPYDPEWPVQFEALKKLYLIHLAGYITAIHHVGSTSVEGLSAKPILDIDLVVKDSGMLLAIIPILESLGYSYRGDLGIANREAFSQLSEQAPHSASHRTWMKHNLYVCIEGSSALNNHLLFRTYLSEHTDAMRSYEKLKVDLAQKYSNDIDLYIKYKTPFITAILEKLGMSDQELSEIKKANGYDK